VTLLRAFLSLAVLCVWLIPGPAHAASAPDDGRAFEPRPQSKPLYGTRAPEDDPDRQTHIVEGHDGVDLFVETWLPAPKKGHKPPRSIPTILVMTPYASLGGDGDFVEYMTARGYAVARHHVRGTGNSGGCLEQTSTNQIDDGARVVEYLGKEAPWSNGRVGMYGASYDAETQISTAGLGDPNRTKYLKAIVPTASVGSQYDWNYMDGVNWFQQPLVGNTSYLAISALPGSTIAPQHYPQKMDCQDEVMLNSLNFTGDFTEYWQQREYRPGATRVEAATLMVHGLRDFNVQPITLAGFFDRLPSSTPHKGLFGVWNHAFPDSHPSVEPQWARADWLPMVTAWFDRYLKGLDTGVERWPDVQVQSSEGQWWAVDEYPTTGGPVGQLALGAKGALGVAAPKGETSYREQVLPGFTMEGEDAVFETPRLKAPLHVTGQPVADLWLKTNRPDGHVAVELEVIGRGGEPLEHEGGEAVATYGVRSLQHLQPMERGWFEQEQGEPVPTDKPVNALVRFLPTDLVVPRGGRLRLTISGSVAYSKGESQTSGSVSTITLLHDCKHSSALRFLLPDRRAELLNVRETDEPPTKELSSRPARMGRLDGAGLGTALVCGEGPRPVAFLR
jgi:X-Pro dipeptidyl-peptidase